MLEAAVRYFELVYHTTVRTVRVQSNGNATLGLISAVGQTLMLVMIFYLLFSLTGMKGGAVRGDPLLFLVSGVLMFFMHNTTLSKTVSAGLSVGPLMMHAPMTPTLVILASALANLYLYVLSFMVILAGLYLFKGSVEINEPSKIILPFILAWASGIAIGLLLLVFKPFVPKLSKLISTLYQRANLITSGKFFVANMLPNAFLPFFAWNPLFHSIDQMRGALFVNYYPHNTSLSYPVYFVLTGLVIGLMLEFWLRNTVSKSTVASN